jgi:hypothetical protein
MDNGSWQGNSDATLENGIEAQRLYEQIVRGANYFLHNCSTFSVESLANHDPSYEEIARLLDSLVKVVSVLSSDFDPMMGQKALEYCLLMKKMSTAIVQRNQPELTRLVAEMKRKPGT